MNSLKTLTNTVKYIGVDDPDQKLFENQYHSPNGMSYNSYIVFGDKIALLDTADSNVADQWLIQAEEALEGREPDFLIAHHMEPDHSAHIAHVMARFPNMKLVTSAKALVMVGQFFEKEDFSGRTIIVGDGDVIDLGNRQLKVFTAPFVHWPEVIMTYDTLDGILFSADAFGKFGALQWEEEWLPEARRYYCNIVGKYGAQVQMLFKKIAGLDIKAIAPLHGPVHVDDIAQCMDAYQHWSTYAPETEGVMIAYASVYGDTAKAAMLLEEKLKENGCENVEMMDLCRCDHSEATAQAFRLSKAVFASITYDASLFPPMHDFLYHLQLKNWQKRKVALIENGTWAPISGKLMADMLSKMKDIEIIEPRLSLKSAVHEADMPTIEAIAKELLS